METIAASGRLAGDSRSKELIDHLMTLTSQLSIEAGVVYYDFPLFRDVDDVLYRCQVLMASRTHGILAFGLPTASERRVDLASATALDESISQLASIIVSKLLKSRALRKSTRELRFPVQSFLVLVDGLEGAVASSALESVVATSFQTIDDWLIANRSPTPLSESAWEELRSSLEGAKGILRPKERDLSARAENSKPAILATLENEIANFDSHQRRAAIQIVNGPQRIRGLAGSGKTIVLAMKAAHLHLSDPDALVLITFHTKSLYSFLKRLITRFYRQFSDRDPNWDRIHVRHSWGGRTTTGVYYEAALSAGVSPATFGDASQRGGFDSVCKELVASGKVVQRYNYVLIDEAQDSPVGFFQLCFALAQGDDYDRNIVWAYDELQNIMNVRMKSSAETFGSDSLGNPLIDLERAAEGSPYGERDVVLHKCYRNPREILVMAHALGFGIYSDVPVQMLENAEHWIDVGYEVEQGASVPGERTVISRPAGNSPSSISDLQAPTEIVAHYTAKDIDQEITRAVKAIRAFIGEGLRADDLMVIALDDRNARAYLQGIGDALVKAGIPVNNILADPYGAPAFLVDDHVTLTTVYRAKGNEAAVVFAVGIDALYPARQMQRGRNKLFTAFTRAKAWLRVSGVGEGADYFFAEMDIALRHFPRLVFTYPDPAAIVTLQRDLTDRASRMRKIRQQFEEQLEMLDLDEHETQFFIDSLGRSKK